MSENSAARRAWKAESMPPMDPPLGGILFVALMIVVVIATTIAVLN